MGEKGALMHTYTHGAPMVREFESLALGLLQPAVLRGTAMTTKHAQVER